MRRGDNSAGVSLGNNGVGFFVTDKFNRAENGGILFALDRLDRFFVHFEELAGVNDFDTRIAALAFGQRRFDFVLFADEEQLADFCVRFQCEFDPINDVATTVVATHSIDCDSHK